MRNNCKSIFAGSKMPSYSGKLKLTIIEAKDLKAADKNGMCGANLEMLANDSQFTCCIRNCDGMNILLCCCYALSKTFLGYPLLYCSFSFGERATLFQAPATPMLSFTSITLRPRTRHRSLRRPSTQNGTTRPRYFWTTASISSSRWSTTTLCMFVSASLAIFAWNQLSSCDLCTHKPVPQLRQAHPLPPPLTSLLVMKFRLFLTSCATPLTRSKGDVDLGSATMPELRESVDMDIWVSRCSILPTNTSYVSWSLSPVHCGCIFAFSHTLFQC